MAGAVSQGGPQGQAQAWPALREELRLYPGPATRWGAPTWTLHDPAAQRFFRLGWLEMEILRRWRLGDPAAIAAVLMAETTLSAPPEAVMAVRQFVLGNNLAVAADPAATAALLKQKRARRKSIVATLLHNYLFLRIPLIKPDAFLSATLGVVRPLFSRAFLVLLLVAAVVGLSLVLREWAVFRDTLASLLTLEGGLLAAAALGMSKTFHEFGHAYAAKRLGLRVPAMGVALMCFAPVLWTDTTEAWKLPRRRDRLLIGASGVAAELLLAACASLLWPLAPEGPVKTALFMLTGSIWILTLMVNINPCMRYDGYYLLSDFWDMPGLQTRAFALAKWFIREQLFGFGKPPPEPFSSWDRGKLIIYALCTWVYRLFLFLGIAFMVYYLFFKALGIVLMVVELSFFITLPILKEVRHWIANRNAMRLNMRTVRTILLFGAAGYFLFAPWHSRVGGAAILLPERRAALYAPMGGVVETVAAVNDLEVAEGDVLFTIRSPDLESRIAIATHKVTAQRLKLSLTSLDQTFRMEMAAEWDELERLAEELAGLLRERSQLTLRAPFAGRVTEMPEWLAEGSWVGGKEPLAALTGGGWQVQAYIPEHALDRIRDRGEGLFYPRGKGSGPIRVTVGEIERQAARDIAQPELTSLYGGPLGAHKNAAGRLEPDASVYRITCSVASPGAPEQILVGQATLDAAPQSLVTDLWRRFIGLLVRESGM